MKILIIEPQKKPIVAEIEDTLKSLQEIVGGYIESFCIDNNATNKTNAYCNEEGKINNLPPNRNIGYDIIHGTFLICGNDQNGANTSLTTEQIKRYEKMFEKPDFIN